MTGRLPFDHDRATTPRRGPVEAALDHALTEWRKAGHLTGAEHAATRNVLRTSAKNLDRALADHDTSPYVVGQLTRWHNDLLTAHAPPGDVADDLDAELEQLARAHGQ
jgi:hypothetical protein